MDLEETVYMKAAGIKSVNRSNGNIDCDALSGQGVTMGIIGGG